MRRRVLQITWRDGMGDLPRGADYAAMVEETLRLCVWRVGCIALACTVTPDDVHLLVHCADTEDPRDLIQWIRDAAAFVISNYTGFAPNWEAPYAYNWLEPECAGVVILRSLAQAHAARTTVL